MDRKIRSKQEKCMKKAKFVPVLMVLALVIGACGGGAGGGGGGGGGDPTVFSPPISGVQVYNDDGTPYTGTVDVVVSETGFYTADDKVGTITGGILNFTLPTTGMGAWSNKINGATLSGGTKAIYMNIALDLDANDLFSPGDKVVSAQKTDGLTFYDAIDYAFTDAVTTVTGTDSYGAVWSASLQPGWNIVWYHGDAGGEFETTNFTGFPSGLRWTIEP
jgi:hypothetical protein